MEVAALAERTVLGRLLSQADLPGTEVRGGDGWVALRSGMCANDLNGVVSEGADGIDAAVVADLVAWLAGVPASWLTSHADPRLTALLLDAGASAERTGRWVGRELPGDLALPEGVLPLGDPADLLDVAEACGLADPGDRVLRRAALRSHPLTVHVVVRRDGRAVGTATGFAGTALEVVQVGVLPEHRRQGIGRTLVEALMVAGRERGLGAVVAAPSPEGGRLFAALGFEVAPVTPDVCFYLTG